MGCFRNFGCRRDLAAVTLRKELVNRLTLIRTEWIDPGTFKPMTYPSTARSGASHLWVARWRGFARWWMSGLREVVPPAWLNWADAEAPPRLMIWRDGESILCRLKSAAGAD